MQTEEGYFYGYWGGVLARYDADTLERTVLYEAAFEQTCFLAEALHTP